MTRFLFVFALALLSALPAMAQDIDESANPDAIYEYQDSIYFTLDDGIQTPEEMEREAMYVARMCRMNAFQNKYYDCECFGGAFLVQREKLGPTVPQESIIMDLVKGKTACANTVVIAGEYYQQCLDFQATYYEMSSEQDNEKLCSCTGNRAANEYSKKPILDPGYAASMLYTGMRYCKDPRNAPVAPARTATSVPDFTPAKTAN